MAEGRCSPAPEGNHTKKGRVKRAPQKEPKPAIQSSADDFKWAADRGLTPEQFAALLEEDCVDPDVDHAPGPVEDDRGTLLKWGTIDTYISAVAELFNIQRSYKINAHENFRGPALKQLLDARRAQDDDISRGDYQDRGAGGLETGYNDEELGRIQEALLENAAQRPQVCAPAGSPFALAALGDGVTRQLV